MSKKIVTPDNYRVALGLTVVGVRRDDDDVVLITKDEEPNIRLSPYGDCCSHTWIESVDLVDSLLGTIRHIEDIDMPERGSGATLDRPSVDSVQFYGLRVTTSAGVAVFDYRNDSNGYYGGSLIMSLDSSKNKRR